MLGGQQSPQGRSAEGCCKDGSCSWVTPKDINRFEITSPPLKFAHPDVGYGNLAEAKNTRGILDWFADRCPRGIRKAMWTDIRI